MCWSGETADGSGGETWGDKSCSSADTGGGGLSEAFLVKSGEEVNKTVSIMTGRDLRRRVSSNASSNSTWPGDLIGLDMVARQERIRMER